MRWDRADGESVMARRPAAVMVVAAGVLFAACAAWAIPWDWVPGGELVPAEANELFTAAQLERIEEYSTTRRALGWGSLATSLVVALGLGLTPLGARLLRRLLGRARWWAAVVLGVFGFTAATRAVTLPFSVAIRQLNLDYGLTEQAWVGWLTDYLKTYLVTAVMLSLVLLAVVGAARLAPRLWFAWASGLVVLLALGGSFLYPIAVEPLFNRFEPMPAGPLRSSVLDLAAEEGVAVDDVLIADASRRTTTLNAYVSGFGASRRIVVYDTLLSELSPEEARVVIAHELSHARHHDVLVGTALGALGGVIGVGLLALLVESRRGRRLSGAGGAADPAAVALLLALISLGTLVASPIQNVASRAVEARADREALEATGAADTFVAMQVALAVRALADPSPSSVHYLWFASHPTVLQRAGLPASLEVGG